MNEILDRVKKAQAGSTTPAEALRALAKAKALEVERVWQGHLGKNMNGVASFQTSGGETHIGHIEVRQDEGGPLGVEVWLGPKEGPPSFFVVNPPMLVPDSAGSEVLEEFDPKTNTTRTRRFRVDPLQAIAEAIGSKNGSENQR